MKIIISLHTLIALLLCNNFAKGAEVDFKRDIAPLLKAKCIECHGLEKQKAGKKRMKQVGSVEIPQDAFLAVLKT